MKKLILVLIFTIFLTNISIAQGYRPYQAKPGMSKSVRYHNKLQKQRMFKSFSRNIFSQKFITIERRNKKRHTFRVR
jgi:hypothetical protein